MQLSNLIDSRCLNQKLVTYYPSYLNNVIKFQCHLSEIVVYKTCFHEETKKKKKKNNQLPDWLPYV